MIMVVIVADVSKRAVVGSAWENEAELAVDKLSGHRSFIDDEQCNFTWNAYACSVGRINFPCTDKVQCQQYYIGSKMCKYSQEGDLHKITLLPKVYDVSLFISGG